MNFGMYHDHCFYIKDFGYINQSLELSWLWTKIHLQQKPLTAFWELNLLWKTKRGLNVKKTFLHQRGCSMEVIIPITMWKHVVDQEKKERKRRTRFHQMLYCQFREQCV